MRVAIIGSRGYPHVYSGYETLVARLAPGLVALGHDVTVYCHHHLFSGRPGEVDGVRLVYIRGLRSKSLAQLSHGLLSTVHAMFQGYDVVLFVNSANGPFGVLLRLARMRSAINVDGLEWLRPKWKGIGGRYFWIASWLATRTCDGVITDADAMASVYQKEFGADSEVIAYGADIAGSSDPGILTGFGLSPRDYYLVVGRLIPDNNLDSIISGFALGKTSRRLVVVGDVPYKDDFATRVRDTADGRVVFTGYVRDQRVLRELYCNCYAYIHGHEFGGTNPTLLKALGFGCCILALDTQFSREVLDGNQYGMYFSKDPEEIASVLDSVDDDAQLVAQMRARAPDRVRARYTWDRIIRQYDAFLSGLS